MDKGNTSANEIVNQENKHEYEEFLSSIKIHFEFYTQKNDIPLFTTDAEGLFDAFLTALPSESRQHYTCHACKYFMDRFGSLVTITENGEIESVLWKEAPAYFAASVENVKNIVLNSSITGVFLSDSATLGKPVTGDWHHISVELPKEMVFHSPLKNAFQVCAEKQEDYNSLVSGLKEYSLETVKKAVMLLKTEALYRSEKCLGVAEWLFQLQKKLFEMKDNKKRKNLIWRAVATAPIGFCHVRSSMIGTLLDDIASDLPYEIIERKFAEKMHPLQYQRPQADPTAGNIQQAEKMVEKLGIQKSLIRRFARLEELKKIWVPKKEEMEENKKGVFSHLIPKDKKEQANLEVPPIIMTWNKFSDTVLPIAEEIEFLVKEKKENFSAILTAEYFDAPPILQWDTEENRNPFSHYVYIGGSSYKNWNLSSGYCKVTGICYQPSMWYGDYKHHGKAVFFLLENAKDTQYQNTGNALFPEFLKAELREIRSTIEAYSKKETILGYQNASACGIRLQYGGKWNYLFRVKTNIGVAVYQLDRWD